MVNFGCKLGGPTWSVLLGRRDSTTANFSGANSNLPVPILNLTQLISAISNQTLSTKDMIALSGGHTIGQVRCTTFRIHIYNESNINTTFTTYLQSSCPFSGGDDNLSPIDTQTSTIFDNSSFTLDGASSSISAKRSLPMSPFLSDMSGTAEESASDRFSPNQEKALLVGVPDPDSNITLHSSSSEKTSAVVGESASIETKVCDYSIGKWVEDHHRPLYSGNMCKRWLSESWACRLTQRTDFSYEKYRWQPDNCDMPNFDGQEFLKRMQSKTLAFIRDSLGRQQFQSMMCMLIGREDSPDVEDVGRAYGLVIARHAIRPDGWAFKFRETNTTVLFYWSASLCAIEPLNGTIGTEVK